MAQYSGKVDDYLRASAGSLEVATDNRFLPIYDPETAEIKFFKIDVSERGGKEVDALLGKVATAVNSAQKDLIQLIDNISSMGGGTHLQRRPKAAAAPKEDPATEEAATGEPDTASDDAPTTPALSNAYQPEPTPSY